MANQEMLARGRRLNKAVREFFAKGHKSGNKLYDDSGNPGVNFDDFEFNNDKSQTRLMQLYESQERRLNLDSKTDYQIAELLVKMPVSDRSGNCLEMAVLSNYFAFKREFVRRELLYMMSITAPGDHSCCVISTEPIASNRRSYSSVAEFTRDNAARAYLVVDPWLNVVCSGDEYLQMGSSQLDRWSGLGKRVCWSGSQGDGWYPPGGEYKDKFAIAPVGLRPF
jgi:hypothetical protein